MSLLPLQPVSHSDVYIHGQVTIDPSATIAPGVILHATADSQIIVSAGACIGMGSILHANEGAIEVEAGVILGAGVLIIGSAQVGANACIGAATTIYNASVARMQFIPAGSVIGDTSRQIEQSPPSEETAPLEEEEVQTVEGSVPESTNGSTPPSPEEKARSPIYGQGHVNQMLLTLFPHRQGLNSKSEKE